MFVTRKDGISTYESIASYTNPDNVLRDEGLYASTTTDADALFIAGIDFSEIPSTATILGIEFLVQGHRADSGSENFVQWACQLGKEGPSGPFTTRKTPLLTTQEQTYIVGSSSDTWGGFTPADLLEVNGFVVAIKSSTKVAISSPTWYADYVAVTVYWDPPAGYDHLPSEPLYLTEKVTASITAAAVKERLLVNDGPAGSGAAITEWRTTANFQSRAGKRSRREAAGVRISVGGAVLHIGDASLILKGNGTLETAVPMSRMQPGLVSVGEIQRTGDYGEDTQYETTSVVLANKQYVDQSGLFGTSKLLSDWFRGISQAGRTMQVWAFVDAGDGWQNRLVFDGLIENVDFLETRAEVQAIQVGTATKAFPDLFVDSTSFSYEPGSTAVDTGEEIPANRGKVIPVGIGRFDYTAVKKETAFAAGHPLRFSPAQSGVAADRKVYSNAAVWPAMWGVLFPMMPAVWAAKNWRRVEGQNGPLGFLSLPSQSVFLYGSRQSVPEFRVDTGPSRSHLYNMLLPGFEYSDASPLQVRGNEWQALQYTTVWTWERSGNSSFGTPFVRDWTTRNTDIPGQQGATTLSYNHHGAGPMDGLGKLPWNVIGRGWSDGTAANAYGVFVNGALPTDAKSIQPINFWLPLAQVAAIPMDGLATDPNRVIAKRNEDAGGPAVWPSFKTEEGTGKTENPLNCIKLQAMEDTTRLNAGSFLAMRCAEGASNLGKMLGVRFVCCWNTSSTTATAMYAFFAFGRRFNRGILPSTAQSLELGDWHSNTTPTGDITNEGKTVQAVKIDINSTTPFASFWMLPMFDTAKLQKREIVDSTKAVPVKPKARGEWTFTSWDYPVTFGSGDTGDENKLVETPWDVMLHIKSGGGLVDLVACWLEVFYVSQFQNSTIGFIHPQIKTPRQVVFHEGWIAGVSNIFDVKPPYFAFEAAGATRDNDQAVVYVTGRGAIDSNGDITGSFNKLIEHPSDVSNALIRHYLGNTVFARRAKGIEFGGFGSTRLSIPNHRGSYVFDEPSTIGKALDRIASQALSFTREQIDDSGNLVWRTFLEVADPDNEYPELLYRTDGFGFHWDDIAKDSFRASLTPVEDLSSNVRVRFGFHLPSQRWSDEKYVNDHSHNLSINGPAYQAAMLSVRNAYAIDNPVVIEAPDIWDPDSAETICKWAADRLRRRRVVVEFDTFANGLDLVPGHVIKFDDEIGQRVKWPGDTSGEWSAKRLNVTRVYPRRDEGRPWIVGVRAIEAYTRAA